jgi:hypothetical protein
MVGRVIAITVIASAVWVTWATAATRSHEGRVRTIPPCRDIILYPKFPYRTGGYRLVLGALSVPPAYAWQVVHVAERQRWPYWRKAGLVVRAGAQAVTVSVPRAWRSRAAITWGNRPGPVSTLKIASCGGPVTEGHAYAGGFYLRAHAACLPLVFQVGDRRATVSFGLGRRC